MMFFLDRRLVRGVGLACVPALLLAGCADVQQAANSLGQQVSALGSSGYASQTADPACFRERATIEQQEQLIDPALVTAAVGGAVLGAGIAAIRGDNILAGAAIGGVSGLAVGYISKLTGVGPYEALRTMTTDVRAETAKVEQFTLALGALRACRVREAEAIRSDLSAKRIERPAAEQRIALVRARHAEDVAKARAVGESVNKNTAGYVESYNEIAAANGTGGLELGEQKVRKTRSPKPKLPKEQSAKLRLQSAADRKGVTELREDCVTNVRKRDDCNKAVSEVENTGFAL